MEGNSGQAAFQCSEESCFETAVSGKGLSAQAETEKDEGSCHGAARVVEKCQHDEKSEKRLRVEKESSSGSSDMVEKGGSKQATKTDGEDGGGNAAPLANAEREKELFSPHLFGFSSDC